MVGAPFARLLANLVVMGGGVLGRAFLDAYKQALSECLPQSSLGPMCMIIDLPLCAGVLQTMAGPLQQQMPPRLVCGLVEVAC